MGVDLEKWLKMSLLLSNMSVMCLNRLLIDFKAFVKSDMAIPHLLESRLPYLINEFTQLILVRQFAVRLFQRGFLESLVEVGFVGV